MAHGLAGQLGGRLDIRSVVGEGTIIDLWLPQAEPLTQEPAIAEAREAAAEAVDAAGRHALVVDDEPVVRSTTADMLQHLGYEVIEAESAAAGEQLLISGKAIDVVITDHMMPGMTGAEFARLIRNAWPSIPVLLVSGFADIGAIPADLPRLAKPFRERELAQALANLEVKSPPVVDAA